MESSVDWSEYFSAAKTPADVKFVRDSWLASYKKSPWAGAVPNNLYTEVYTNAIDQLLARGAKLLFVRNPANPELIIGWICFEILPRNEVVIHFTYVKAPYRKNGVAKSLLGKVLGATRQTRAFYTFKTGCSRYFSNATFRPEIARRHKNASVQH